jgi:hypothetical protein
MNRLFKAILEYFSSHHGFSPGSTKETSGKSKPRDLEDRDTAM